MGKVRIKHYVVRKGRGYWLATSAMKSMGFAHVRCGPDGPQAWAVATEWEERWQAARRGELPPVAKQWPDDSIGAAFDRFRRSGSWAEGRKARTREDWERGWAYIAPVFGDQSPRDVTFEHLDVWYHRLKGKHGTNEAFRAMKIWRALYKILRSMKLVDGEDPSLAVRRETPKPRSAYWTEGEAVRLVKGAWRSGYRGLACIVAVAWDTGFAPVDIRTLTPTDAFEAGDDWGFMISRSKTGAPAFGTLSARTRALILTYLDRLEFSILPETPLFRSRGFIPGPKGGRPRMGVPYTKDALVDDFSDVRRIVFGPADKRQLMDMRRSGAREASAGDVAMPALAAKMANSIDSSKALQRTYLPVNLAAVRAADAARRKGRMRLASEHNRHKKLKLDGSKS